MGLLQKWFHKKKAVEKNAVDLTDSKKIVPTESTAENADWEKVALFRPVAKADEIIPALVATSIASGDRPESQFEIVSIKEVDPDVKVVGLIASAIAAFDAPESHFVVKNIYRKKN